MLYIKKVKAEYEKELKETQAQYSQFQQLYQAYQNATAIVQKHLDKEDFTLEDLEAITTHQPAGKPGQSHYVIYGRK